MTLRENLQQTEGRCSMDPITIKVVDPDECG